MQANKTVSINGRLYDAVTGLPVKGTVEKSAPAKRSLGTSSTAHKTPQKSQTLHRRSTKKPGLPQRRKAGQHMDIARSKNVSRFASHPTPAKTTATPADVTPKTHTVAARAHAKTTKPAKALASTPKQIKDKAIEAALTMKEKKAPKKKQKRTIPRRFIIISSILLAMIVAAYVVYISIPSISVSIAANQAGINASYPEFKPDGYRLSQPVQYSDGEVSLSFISNSNTSEYTIIQTRSTWDSTAVLENVVKPAVGENYDTTQERGLTIYSYDGNATWVNGGILYVIENSAPLSGEQIRRIATSL